jgi:hypothetical protein
VAGRSEHDCIAFGLPAERMRGRIGMVVSFDLDDRTADSIDQERCAD